MQTLNGRRVLVLGGAGAIGSNLVAALVPTNRVVVVDDLSSGWAENVPKEAELIVGDILDPAVLGRAFRERVDVVFHLAARFANQNSVDCPEQDLLVNGLGILRVLERSKQAGVDRFVFASSSCVYGHREGACRVEDQEFNPGTPYAITKLLGERYVRFFQHFYRLPTVVIRYFNVYGPGERPGPYRNVIPNFFVKVLRNEPLTITGDGSETRDFTFVRDALSATIAAAVSEQAVGQTYNIGSGVETSILTLAQEINSLTGNPAGIKFLPLRNWDTVKRRLADIGHVRRTLGYQPTVSLADGLRETWRWFSEQAAAGRIAP